MDQRWFKIKVLDEYASVMAPHNFTFALESLHSLACLWESEEGLWNCHPKYHVSSFLFQDLHYQRENG